MHYNLNSEVIANYFSRAAVRKQGAKEDTLKKKETPRNSWLEKITQ
jgi:hypothetical protein